VVAAEADANLWQLAEAMAAAVQALRETDEREAGP
jgi:hypothetical protein